MDLLGPLIKSTLWTWTHHPALNLHCGYRLVIVIFNSHVTWTGSGKIICTIASCVASINQYQGLVWCRKIYNQNAASTSEIAVPSLVMVSAWIIARCLTLSPLLLLFLQLCKPGRQWFHKHLFSRLMSSFGWSRYPRTQNVLVSSTTAPIKAKAEVHLHLHMPL